MPDLIWFDRPVVIPDELLRTPEAFAAAAESTTGCDPEDIKDPSAIIANRHWAREALPVGNGRLGCTAFGGTTREQVQFNQDSLWVGNEHNTGAYQPFGEIHVELGHDDVSDYRRQLDLSKALHTVTYTCGGVKHTREYFASHPARVMVLRFTADQPGALTGRICLTNQHDIPTTAQGNELVMAGKTEQLWYWKLLQNDPDRMQANRAFTSDQIISLDFEARIRVLHEGGQAASDGGVIAFKDCDSLTLLVAADTSYINRRDLGWTTDHPHEKIVALLDAAAQRSFDDLLNEHVADFQNIYNRVAIDLGGVPQEAAALTTGQRVERYRQQLDKERSPDDHGLEALMYRYARYLMICSSRPGDGCLPANLQGIWLATRRPAWRCDFHTDVNIQMNYWFVDQANLPECFLPFAQWIDSIRDVRKEETRNVVGVERGWLMRSENGIFGGSTWHIQKGDSAWLCQNLWDHFAFTRDKQYLERYAYPVMKEISHFWLDHLKELPDGTLVAPDGRSPEHGPTKADGVSYDQQLCWDLFNNTIEASAALGVDEDLRAELTDKRDRLLGPRVGRWGQLQEWMDDIDDPLCNHRHVSHMIAIHPGRQVHPSTTPEIAEAAKVSLRARRDADPAWGKVWRAAIFARLREPEEAYYRLTRTVYERTYANLWTTHPPFQIDANFGFASAVNEMLAQSHTGQIELLPALPDAWSDGQITGMRVRGGYELGMSWAKGKLTRATLRGVSNETESRQVRYAGASHTVTLKPGDEIELTPDAFGS